MTAMGFVSHSSLTGTATVVAATAFLALGCAPKYEDLKVFNQAHDHDVSASRYRIDPPDVITITSATSPEVDGVSQRVGVDGKITLKLIGEVKVSKLTPREVAVKIEELLSRYYVDPKVHVRISAYQSKHVYVFGEVGAQGPQPFTGHDTVLDVVSNAGPTFLAWLAVVKVVRPSASKDERRDLIVDVDRMIKKGDLRANFLLQEGDIIYIPPTPLAWIGLRMQEILFPVQPMLSNYNSPLQFKSTTRAYQNTN